MKHKDLKMIMVMWINVVLFNEFDSAQTNGIHQPNPVITASAGDNVTLQCFLLGEHNTEPISWYKQAGGHEPSLVAVVQKAQDPIYKDELNSPRFRIEIGSKNCHLRIINVNPSDEAMYYCGLNVLHTVFAKGTFLSVKGDGDVKVSVFQSSMLNLVPAGASVTLQCSVLSESRSADLQVLWFRAALPQSHPQIIHTHHNSSHQYESGSSTHTCVYNFSKNILSLNDTGTYYCAVAVCGKIIFGNGTRVQLKESVDPVVIFLTVALGACVFVISVQVVLFCKWRNREQHTQRQSTRQTNPQDRDSVELNYAALHFKEKKSKGGRKSRERPQDTVYSEVRYLAET